LMSQILMTRTLSRQLFRGDENTNNLFIYPTIKLYMQKKKILVNIFDFNEEVN